MNVSEHYANHVLYLIMPLIGKKKKKKNSFDEYLEGKMFEQGQLKCMHQEDLHQTLYLLHCEDYNLSRHMIAYDQPAKKRQIFKNKPVRYFRSQMDTDKTCNHT